VNNRLRAPTLGDHGYDAFTLTRAARVHVTTIVAIMSASGMMNLPKASRHGTGRRCCSFRAAPKLLGVTNFFLAGSDQPEERSRRLLRWKEME